MSKTLVRDFNGAMVDINEVQLPNNRTFRNAWVKTDGPVVVVHMGEAKRMFKEAAAAAARKIWLEETLPAYIDAEMSGNASEQAKLKARRGKSRQSATVDVEGAQSVDELVALWDEDALGANPFAA